MSRRKVLVVDDSQVMQVKIQNALQGIGCEVLIAENGAAGLEILRKDDTIKLIIADMNMPGMTGIDMCELARQIPQHKNTAIMMCTTESSASQKERAKSINIKCWIVKPFDESRLQKTVEIVLGPVQK